MNQRIKYFYLFCSSLLFCSCTNSTAPGLHPFTVMSYNIRFDTDRDTGSHDWENRKEEVANVMRNADLIGIQEPTRGQVDDLAALLPEYASFARDTFDINAIFYSPGNFQLVTADTIRLPRLDGSAVNHTIHWAYFRSRKNDLPFLMYNTHLDHAGPQARIRAAHLLTDSLQAQKERFRVSSVIITGDFNSTATAEPYTHVIENGYKDASAAVDYDGVMNTFTGWGISHLWNEWKASFGKPQYFIRIDFIFIRSFEVTDFQLIESKASDHFPIIATLQQ